MKKFGLIFVILIFAAVCSSVFAEEAQTSGVKNIIVKEAQEENLNSYLEYVKTKIEPKWPFNLCADDVAIIEVKISKDGTLLESEIVQSSGNKELDDFVLESAKKASPFEPFPSGFQNIKYIKAKYGFGQKNKYITPNEGKRRIENAKDNQSPLEIKSNNTKTQVFSEE